MCACVRVANAGFRVGSPLQKNPSSLPLFLLSLCLCFCSFLLLSSPRLNRRPIRHRNRRSRLDLRDAIIPQQWTRPRHQAVTVRPSPIVEIQSTND